MGGKRKEQYIRKKKDENGGEDPREMERVNESFHEDRPHRLVLTDEFDTYGRQDARPKPH